MRIPVVITALALAWAALPAPAVDMGGTPTVTAPTVQERLAKARQAIERKDWSSAQRELDAAMREAPQNADVHSLLGYTYRKRASPDMAKAFEQYNLALKFDPNHKGAREYLGEAYLQEKRLPEAEQQLVALEKICGGPACEEYEDLAKAIAAYKTAR